MRSFAQWQRGARRRAARWMEPRDPAEPTRPAFYTQQPTCQIPPLWFLFEKFLGRRGTGVFVEVGAYDGVFVSNTWGLAERGWYGWMVEPVPPLAALCRQNHRTHANVHVVEQAIGPTGELEVTLHLADTVTTANPEAFREYAGIDWSAASLTNEKIVVPCTTLDDFLAQHEIPRGFDVLVVDVEGFEAEVFSAFDLADWQPKMLIVELADTHPDLTATAAKDARLGGRILEQGYRIAFKDSVNTVFVREDLWSAAFTQ